MWTFRRLSIWPRPGTLKSPNHQPRNVVAFEERDVRRRHDDHHRIFEAIISRDPWRAENADARSRCERQIVLGALAVIAGGHSRSAPPRLKPPIAGDPATNAFNSKMGVGSFAVVAINVDAMRSDGLRSAAAQPVSLTLLSVVS